jgi:Lrp/AsnC family transcriptional regulator, regulator for asnA, asnC and gidA
MPRVQGTDFAPRTPEFCENRDMPAQTFDDLDRRIIDELFEDARRPFTAVAKDLGVAEATIRARVARLLRLDAIRFVTDVKPHELGLLFAYLGVRIQGQDVPRAIDAICRIPEAVYVIECTGNYDVLVEVVATDGDDLLRLMQQEIRKVPGVTEVDSFVGLRIAKGTFRYTDLGRGGPGER